MTKTIAILGEYVPTNPTHTATNDSIEHSCAYLGADVRAEWIPTDTIDPSVLARASGILVAPGSPYRDMEKTLSAIRHARERNIPCFGTCGGFQHMVLEYARNALGVPDAQHAEHDPYASRLFITRLACSLKGRDMTLTFTPGSQIARLYEATSATESYYCNFGVAEEYIPALKSGPVRVTAADPEGEVRVIELPGHPFFIGTLFIPQTRSTARAPHPVVTGFVRAAASTPQPGAETATPPSTYLRNNGESQ